MLHMLFTFLMIFGRARRFSTRKEEFTPCLIVELLFSREWGRIFNSWLKDAGGNMADKFAYYIV